MPAIDYHAVAPELILSGALIAVLCVDLFLPEKRKAWNSTLTALGVLGALGALFTLVGERRTTFGGMFVLDSFSLLFKFLFLAVAVVVVLMSADYLNDSLRSSQGEFYFLLLSSFLGAMLMASARDLLMLFVALEMVSVPAFLLAGFRKTDPRSTEAALKFFLIGVLSSAVMLFGMSLIYGVAQSTNLAEIGAALKARGDDPLVTASIMLILAGFGFKVSAVPFHFWAPDTYEGAPVPVAAFLSVASKAAGFAGLLQVAFLAFGGQTTAWGPGLAILSVATMTIGNVVALTQTNIVRLLAYSSIAHAGYMLMPLGVVAGQGAAIQRQAFAASLTYILVYSFMNLGAFAVVVAVGRKRPWNLISDYEGLSEREPGLALAMLFFLLSLAGIPPLAGFWAKFLVFGAAIDSGTAWLAAVMVLNSVVGLYYYLSVGAKMYLRPAEDPSPIGVPVPLVVAIAVALIVVVAVGVFPDFFNHFAPGATLIAL
ncbi:MAG: NADH-quinone oxidoreductase subunit N [Acidobacteria bacterium]|nr:NADH-quinone oxidoreductase subunit N [Acidobacteriota bacterium]